MIERCADCDVPWTYNLACQRCRERKLRATTCRRERQLMQADFVREWDHKVARIKDGCDCLGPDQCQWRKPT